MDMLEGVFFMQNLISVPVPMTSCRQEAYLQRLRRQFPFVYIRPLTRTAFGRRAARGEFRAVDEEVSEEEFLTVHDTLTAAGFEHYEVSNYALPGFRARHNASYWHGTKYLGIGPAAHSFDGEERHWNASSVEKYIAGAPAGKEVLTRRDRFNEYVMTALRTVEGIDLEEAAARFGAKRLARMQEEAAPFLRSGTLRIARGRMALPPEKFLISDAVIGALFET